MLVPKKRFKNEAARPSNETSYLGLGKCYMYGKNMSYCYFCTLPDPAYQSYT